MFLSYKVFLYTLRVHTLLCFIAAAFIVPRMTHSLVVTCFFAGLSLMSFVLSITFNVMDIVWKVEESKEKLP